MGLLLNDVDEEVIALIWWVLVERLELADSHVNLCKFEHKELLCRRCD